MFLIMCERRNIFGAPWTSKRAKEGTVNNLVCECFVRTATDEVSYPLWASLRSHFFPLSHHCIAGLNCAEKLQLMQSHNYSALKNIFL